MKIQDTRGQVRPNQKSGGAKEKLYPIRSKKGGTGKREGAKNLPQQTKNYRYTVKKKRYRRGKKVPYTLV